MELSEKYLTDLKNLEFACKRKDTLLIIHYHKILSSEPHYNAQNTLQELKRSMESDLQYAQECAEEGNMWSMDKNIQTALFASGHLKSSMNCIQTTQDASTYIQYSIDDRVVGIRSLYFKGRSS